MVYDGFECVWDDMVGIFGFVGYYWEVFWFFNIIFGDVDVVDKWLKVCWCGVVDLWFGIFLVLEVEMVV